MKKTARPRHAPRDPHGCVAHRSSTALLLIDVINPFDFPEASQLLRFARPAAQRIAALKERLQACGIPVIYVNDNFSLWQSDFRAQVEHCTRQEAAGADIAGLLRPGPHDYFVLKPKHSGFYSTSLEVLLRYLGAQHLVLAGFAGNICVQYTANDAYMRDLKLFVPQDCCASESAALNRAAVEQMRDTLRADVRPSTSRGLLQAILKAQGG